jgi:hypothetical protein
MANFVVTLTTKGREFEAQQLLYGYGFKVNFFVLGGGGHDPQNAQNALPIRPDVTSLPGQFFGPEPIDTADLVNTTCPRFVCIAQPGEAVGQISNIGLIGTVTYVPGAGFAVLPSDIDAIAGTITHANHGLTNGTTLQFGTTGTLPSGLSAGTTYYVTAATTNTFKVALTADTNAAAVVLGSQGAGLHSVLYGIIPGAPTVGSQFLYAISNFPARTKLASSRETFTVSIKT